MKITAIAPWFGGKRTMADEIIAELGPHRQYFELFCGSMAALLAKSPAAQETVNDLHGELTNLAMVLQNPVWCPGLYERLNRVLVCEGLLEESRRRLETLPSLSSIAGLANEPAWAARRNRAHWYFLSSWMGRNGTAGTERVDYQIAVRWTHGGGSPAVRFRNAVESIPAWHERLKNVVILSRDAFEIIPRIDDAAGVAIYADPPYPSETRSCFGSSSGSSRYLHEFDHGGDDLFGGNDDHTRLAGLLSRFKRARVVVSSYDGPRIRELYAGWTIIDKSRLKNLHNQTAGEYAPKEAPEVLIVNGASFA